MVTRQPIHGCDCGSDPIEKDRLGFTQLSLSDFSAPDVCFFLSVFLHPAVLLTCVSMFHLGSSPSLIGLCIHMSRHILI